MAFCTKCGKPINEGEQCPCTTQPAEGTAAPVESVSAAPAAPAPAEAPAPTAPVQPQPVAAQPVAAQPVQAAPVQPVAAQPVAQPMAAAPANTMFSDYLGQVKNIFSGRVVQTVSAAAQDSGSNWWLTLALGAVLNGLLWGCIGSNIISQVIKSVLGAASGLAMAGMGLAGMSVPSFSFGTCFLAGLLAFAILYFLVVVMLLACYGILKAKVPFANIANMVSAALVPALACLALGVVVSLFWAVGAIGLMFLPIIPTFILLYMGMQRATKLAKTPFWAFSAGSVVLIIVFSFILTNLLLPMILNDFIKSFGDISDLLYYLF